MKLNNIQNRFVVLWKLALKGHGRGNFIISYIMEWYFAITGLSMFASKVLFSSVHYLFENSTTYNTTLNRYTYSNINKF